MRRMVEFRKREDGSALVIEMLPEGYNEAQERLEGLDDEGRDRVLDGECLFRDLIEYQLCNGWEIVPPEQIGALTDGLIISDDVTKNDDGDVTACGKVYWDSNYQVRSLGRTLYLTGSCAMICRE